MNCGQCQELLVEYSLGELDRAAAEQVDRHLADGCEACGQELVEMQEALGMLGASLEPLEPPQGVKQQLLKRIAAEQIESEPTYVQTPATVTFAPRSAKLPKWQRVFAYAATLLCGFLIGALATRYYPRGGVPSVDPAAQLADILESARRDFGSPQIRFAALHPAGDEDAVVGHLMWDARGRNLHFFAFDVEPAAENHELAVWFIGGNGELTYAGELAVSPTGACSAVFQAPEDGEPVTQIVVTEEPAGDVAEPQGPQRIISRFEQPQADS